MAFAVAVGLAAVAVGWNAEGMLADGLVRGVPEAAAVLGCYAALGRELALRLPTNGHRDDEGPSHQAINVDERMRTKNPNSHQRP